MKGNPYVGPRPYERGDRDRFYGRNREARDLLALVLAERVVLFYAQSGAGKSSLLNAKIIPGLEEEGFDILPLVRVGSELPPGIIHAEIDNIFVFSVLLGLAGENVAPKRLRRHTLLSFLESFYPLAQDKIAERPPILILDQFEELFTTHQARWQDAQGFFEQVREALERIPSLGVVFVMREDHVAAMDAYASLLPKRLRARFRMERLGPEGALDAVKKPALQAGCPFDPGVAERLVDDLRRIKTERPAPSPDGAGALGPYVEPVQLQVVCSRLWENLPEQADQAIQWEEVEQFGDIDRALTDFYENALEQAVQRAGCSQRQLRRWVGQELITPMETRGLVLRGGHETGGLVNEAVDVLESQHLIRAERRSGARWYELAHDRLVEPILQANEVWEQAHDTPLRATARLWSETQDASLLYRDGVLRESLEWAEQSPAEIEPFEREFLDASQQAERARRRMRLLSIGGAVLAVLVIVVISYLGIKAEQARQQAERAQQEAERQERIALARQLAAQTLTFLDEGLDLALLLSLEANRLADLVEVKGSLPAALSASPNLVTFLHGHSEGVTSVALNPAGTILASGDSSGSIILWDLPARKQLGLPLVGHQETVRDLAFSPDGQLLASAGGDGTVILWQLDSRQPLDPPLSDGDTDVVRGVAFSPDGQILASAGDDKVILWDVTSRQPLAPPLMGHELYVLSVAFSPDGRLLASSGCHDLQGGSCVAGEIRLWDVATGQLLDSPWVGHDGWVLDVAFSPDGRLLASGSRDQTVLVWDVVTGTPYGPALVGHDDYVTSVTFGTDGQTLASGSDDNTIILWNMSELASGQALALADQKQLSGHTGPVQSLVFGPDGHTLVSGSADDKIIVWDITARQALGETRVGDGGQMLSLALSPDGQLLAAGSSSGQIVLWDAATGQPLSPTLSGHTGWVNSVAFSPDGLTLASGGADSTIILWDMGTGQPAGAPLTAHADEVNSVAFGTDGLILASGGADGDIRLWDVATGQPVALAGHGASVLSVAFSPDGKLLASGGADDHVILWDVSGNEPVSQTLTGHTYWVNSVAFSPDGQTLASGSADNTIIVWDVATRQAVDLALVGHNNWVRSVTFSPDGELLASASDDQTVILWDLATKRPFGPPLSGHTDWVKSVIVYPDGRTLASGGRDGTLVLWDIDFESWKSRACRRANRNLSLDEWTEFVDVDPESYQRSCLELPSGQDVAP